MKTLISIVLFAALACFGQQKVTIPAVLKMDVTFELPDMPPQTNDASVIIITNVYYINTNIYTTINITTNITYVGGGASLSPKIVILTDNVINPDLGTRLQRNFGAPTAFTFGSFRTNSFTTFYWRNPNRQRITWPAGVVWLNGPAPTNQIRGAVLFEWNESENAVWATQ